ncbi:MAG: hypothetical protein WBP38_06510 [Hyphomicrobium sp.]|jgi:hypothetical protein|nr:hypothetical protein [Hyphomicrobium sp.]
MATILEFRQGPRNVGKLSRNAAATPAEIVFFPGVRYERWEDTGKQKSKKRARRRDRLEIDGSA